MSGSFGVGVWHPKSEVNIGTLWRSAFQLGASFVFTIGRRYRRQASDTYSTPHNVPLWHFETLDELKVPHGHELVAVEFCAGSSGLPEFGHLAQAVYLLGAEDHGLPAHVLARCHRAVSIPCAPGRPQSFNVAVAGSLVMYDRLAKRSAGRPALKAVAR